MRVFIRSLGLVAAFLLSTGGWASGQAATTYANVKIVSMDPTTRLVVIQNSSGDQETLELDDSVAGMEGVTAGDDVIMAVRGEPGRRRISAITKALGRPKATPTSPARPEEPAAATRAAGGHVEGLMRFTEQVAALSRQAQPIDALWSEFTSACAAKTSGSVEGARPWFGLWDGRVKADLSSGFCRDLFNQIVSSGESVKSGMAAAEEVAGKSLIPGEIRDVRRLHGMDWDGWALRAPEKLGL
jgi:hypothetical protein